jgi:hypothetical protein
MKVILILLFFFSGLFKPVLLFAQRDTSIADYNKSGVEYLKITNKKISLYSDRISKKTEKTLKRLMKFEKKVHEILLKVHPETAQKLFGNGRETFTSLYEKLNTNSQYFNENLNKYNSYQDKIFTTAKFIETNSNDFDSITQKKALLLLSNYDSLRDVLSTNEQVSKFINLRKKELIDESIKYLSQNIKIFRKINKEAYYYKETLKNYENLFSDERKAEELAISILSKVEGFEAFSKSQSQFAALSIPNNLGNGLQLGGSQKIINGIGSRIDLQNQLKNSYPSESGINLSQKIFSNLSEFRSQLDNSDYLNKIKEWVPKEKIKFKINTQKTKLVKQRIEYGFDIQFSKSKKYIPSSMKAGFNVGYKLSDFFSFGIGASFDLGLGFGWDNINLTPLSIGARGYLKRKISKGFSILGSFESNALSPNFKSYSSFVHLNSWKQSALLGIVKSYRLSGKKKGNIQFFYDFLHNYKLPKTDPFVLRMGYEF